MLDSRVPVESSWAGPTTSDSRRIAIGKPHDMRGIDHDETVTIQVTPTLIKRRRQYRPASPTPPSVRHQFSHLTTCSSKVSETKEETNRLSDGRCRETKEETEAAAAAAAAAPRPAV
ncbi:Xyloglucan endotransglucosylase/hydrolase [Psidium guajava]|nr:Xyloglucan endotransglucosylase/hydrolase [Psidium guajava]